MKSIISYKCLGVRNVNLFNVGIKIFWYFFIFDIIGSVKIESGFSFWIFEGFC